MEEEEETKKVWFPQKERRKLQVMWFTYYWKSGKEEEFVFKYSSQVFPVIVRKGKAGKEIHVSRND